MRLPRRALLLLGLLGLLTGLFAMHGLAPAAGTDILAAGPHQHPAALLATAGPAHRPADAPVDGPVDGLAPGHGLAAANAARTVTDQRMPDGARPDEAMSASSGAPAPGHGGHGSHLEGLCLAVLAGGAAFLLVIALLGGRGSGAAARESLRRLGAVAPGLTRALAPGLGPPDLARLCVLRI